MPEGTVVERLAVELHRQYRAAEKALNGPDRTDTVPALKDGVMLRHDHSWEGCHKQKYFLQRARTVVRRSLIENPATLGEAEQALDATVLMRRLNVEGQRHTDRFSRTVGDEQREIIGKDLKADDFYYARGR